jgi:hypothetical protein
MAYAAIARAGTSEPAEFIDQGVLKPTPVEGTEFPPVPQAPDPETWGMDADAQAGLAAAEDFLRGA